PLSPHAYAAVLSPLPRCYLPPAVSWCTPTTRNATILSIDHSQTPARSQGSTPPSVTSLMVVGQQNFTAGPKALGFHAKCSSQTTISHPVLLSAQSLPLGWVSKPLMSVSDCSRCNMHAESVVQTTQKI